MTEEESLYLDLVRFGMAFIVLLSHVCAQALSGGLLWQIKPYGHTAVAVFFVLSGYVIAYVTERREKEAWSYGASRFARLYSVCLPALLLTLVCDTVGSMLDHDLYVSGRAGPFNATPFDYVTSLFLVHGFWEFDTTPGTNLPFWSLSNEAAYYLAFAIMMFAKGPARLLALLALGLAAGAYVVSLFPIWLIGVACYRWGRAVSLGPRLAWLAWIGSIGVFVAAPTVANHLGPLLTDRLQTKLVIHFYVAGLAFGVHLVVMQPCVRQLGLLLRRLAPVIRWLGSLTFAMYLFHRPLLSFFAAMTPADKASIESRVVVLGGTLLLIALFGTWCEQLKVPLRRGVLGFCAPIRRDLVKAGAPGRGSPT